MLCISQIYGGEDLNLYTSLVSLRTLREVDGVESIAKPTVRGSQHPCFHSKLP